MRGVLNPLDPIVPPDELHDALQKVLSDHFSEPITIIEWHREVSQYSSSAFASTLVSVFLCASCFVKGSNPAGVCLI